MLPTAVVNATSHILLYHLHDPIGTPHIALCNTWATQLETHVLYHMPASGAASSHLDSIEANVMRYSSSQIRTRFPRVFNGSRGQHVSVYPRIVLWYEAHPGIRINHHHIWSIEKDAFFAGDVRRFFDIFAGDNADLVSSKFNVFGTKFFAFPPKTLLPVSVKRGNVSRLMHGLYGWSATEGVLWRQSIVERASLNLLRRLRAWLDAGRAMHSEIFASTVCALAAPRCTLSSWSALVPCAFGTGFNVNTKHYRALFPAWSNRTCGLMRRRWLHPLDVLKKSTVPKQVLGELSECMRSHSARVAPPSPPMPRARRLGRFCN